MSHPLICQKKNNKYRKIVTKLPIKKLFIVAIIVRRAIFIKPKIVKINLGFLENLMAVDLMPILRSSSISAKA